MQEVLHKVGILFDDLAILDAAHAPDTLTQRSIRMLQDLGVISYRDGGKDRVCSIPVGSPDELQDVSRQISQLFHAFINTHFPDYEQVDSFAALHLDRSLSWKQRRSLMGTLATLQQCSEEDLWLLSVNSQALSVFRFMVEVSGLITFRLEGVWQDPETWSLGPRIVRKQLVGPAAAVAGEEPKMGIFARALWFHKHGAAAKAASVPGLQKMLDQYGPSAGAWILTLQDMTPQQRRDRPLAVGLICKSLTAQTGTQSVERWLGEVRFAELKHRARALAEDTLESCVKLNVQDFTGRLAGKAFNPDSLFRDQAQSAQRGVRHRASQQLWFAVPEFLSSAVRRKEGSWQKSSSCRPRSGGQAEAESHSQNGWSSEGDHEGCPGKAHAVCQPGCCGF